MTTSCGARSCFSIFPSCDRGPPTLPVSRSISRKPIRKRFQDTQTGRKRTSIAATIQILFQHAPVSTARPRTRVRRSLGATVAGMAASLELISNVPELATESNAVDGAGALKVTNPRGGRLNQDDLFDHRQDFRNHHRDIDGDSLGLHRLPHVVLNLDRQSVRLAD